MFFIDALSNIFYWDHANQIAYERANAVQQHKNVYNCQVINDQKKLTFCTNFFHEIKVIYFNPMNKCTIFFFSHQRKIALIGNSNRRKRFFFHAHKYQLVSSVYTLPFTVFFSIYFLAFYSFCSLKHVFKRKLIKIKRS